MAKKNLDLAHEGLGDIDSILHNQGVSDLSWLSVDEEEYRKAEALPKQNLDIIPELQKALTMDKDDGIPHVIPLRPHTIVNTNPLEGLPKPVRDMSSPIRQRVARLVMAGVPSKKIGETLQLEFAPAEIRAAASVIKEVLSERGLLGNVYVEASHFPNASRDPKEKKLAQLLSKNALFVVAGCRGVNGCNCHESGYCSTFGGKRVVQTPNSFYTAELAAHYAPQLAAEKRPLDLRVAGSVNWKERIRQAFLSPIATVRPDGVRTVQYQAAQTKPQVTSQDVADFLDRRFQSSGIDPMPSAAYMKYARRMATGMDDRSILVAAEEPELRALAGEFGLLGHTWLDMDALGGCRNTLACIESYGLKPDFVLRRSAVCHQCKGAVDGACVAICKTASLVTSKPSYDKQIFAFALRRAAVQGRVTPQQMTVALSKAPDGSNWASLTRQANLLSAPLEDHSQYTGAQVSAYYGDRGSELGEVSIDPEKVRRTISHLMNSGLHGKSLQAAILKIYSRTDLVQVPAVGRRAAAEDGVQGQYFIDPTAYMDYGHGCNEGAGYFRKRGAKNVLASESCTGCVLQTAPGWCSKYAKDLIRSVPNEVRAHVASAKRQLPVVQVKNVDPADQFQLSSEIEIDMNGGKSRGIAIDISGPTLDE